MIITPPMRGSITLSSRASFISSCPTTWVKGKTLRLRTGVTDEWLELIRIVSQLASQLASQLD